MKDFLNDQETINGVLLFILTYIALGITKISIVQDAIKDELILFLNKTKLKQK